MPDWTVEDRIQFETDRIVNFGSDASVTLYDEAGEVLITIEQFWFLYKLRNWAANSFDYHLKIAEDETSYKDQMKVVKTIRYLIDGALSDTYTHHGIEAPELGGKRTWIVKVDKPAFRNSFFSGA